MAKVPYDPVSELKAVAFENRIQNGVKRDDFPIFNVVSNLPAEGACVVQKTDTLLNHDLLGLHV